MSIQIKRIKSYLDKTFTGKINLSDLQKKPSEEIHRNFLSRALSAYALTIVAGTSIEDAGEAITDGYDDNGIDAIFYDKQTKHLWLVQSKFIEKGVGSIENGEILKFKEGVKNLIDGEFSRFNSKIKDKQDDILEALEDASVKIQILFAYTGDGLSSHNTTSINDLLNEQNGSEEILFFTDFNISKVYKGLETGISLAPINEDIQIHDWGCIEQPLKSYYGQVAGSDLGELWKKYGKRLFTENIRNFLGNSTVNDEITKTIKSEAANFIYFNNGITVLCTSIKKTPKGGNSKSVGTFTCNGISVVNGAQTLGSIGSLYESNLNELANLKVIVKFISLEDSSEGFGQRITVATNTQNRIEKKDFISLDSEQSRIKLELKLENIDYHFKRTDEKIVADPSNYLLEEVAFSLASLWQDVDYSTMVKKESGKLWEDVTAAPYTNLFNQKVSAQTIIKALRVYRFISNKMNSLSKTAPTARERSIYRYGNSLVSHIIFQKIPKEMWGDNYLNFDSFMENELLSITDAHTKSLVQSIERIFPDSMIVYTLRNYTKCRLLKALMIK
jgi:hypothetical protein